ncbi:MAG: CPBP family intramembrane metalloprotease [Solobacterium sp.]|nr:CPBP family intramembrane metalloprotease [Solobacterium sp.]
MRMFLYYAWHSFFNQLRKIFKTWVLVFILVCGLLGGLIGFSIASLEEATQTEEIVEIESEEITAEFSLENEIGIDGIAVAELAAGGIILVLFAYELLSAEKNGSRIFLPADVNLLFSSPMKPQSVLLFRLATQLGTALAGSLYLLFQLPNLMINLHLSLWAALGLLCTWVLTIMIGKLLQLMAYTITSTNPSYKKYITYFVYGLGALCVISYSFYYKTHSESLIVAANAFFNSSLARMIPFWGWLKGFLHSMMTGNGLFCLLYFGLLVIGMACLIYFIWNIKADFYEDAMAKSEEVAEMLEKINKEESGIFFRKRKKDREDSIRRDGFHYGEGASVFFYKELYNRFRFAKLHYFTKTSITYLIVSVILSLFLYFVAETTAFEPVAILLSIMVFFRTLGNPLNQDVKTNQFLLIPESTWKKLLCSWLAGTCNCLLDLLPSFIVSSILLRQNPLLGLLWMIPIASVDFYATAVGAFLDLSIPSSIGKTIKQLIQVFFIYFGLLPDIAVIATGYALHHPLIGVLAASVVNVYLGMVFFGLSTIFAEAQGGVQKPVAKENADVPSAKKTYSTLGIACFLILILSAALQLGFSRYILDMNIAYNQWKWLIWVITFVPIYLVGVPCGLLWMKRIPSVPLQEKALPGKYYFLLPVISIFLLYAGNIIGIAITSFVNSFVQNSGVNPLNNLIANQSVYLRILFMVILAPFIEEYIFRKQLIDKMHVHGGKMAVLTSALMFGLFHGNTSQMFYAFFLGLLFGYVYLKTGRLRYTVILHMLINFMGSVAGPYLMNQAISSFPTVSQIQDSSAMQIFTPQVIVLIVYLLALVALALIGLVFFFREIRQIRFITEENQLSEKGALKPLWINTGMTLFFIGCAGMIVYSFLS